MQNWENGSWRGKPDLTRASDKIRLLFVVTPTFLLLLGLARRTTKHSQSRTSILRSLSHGHRTPGPTVPRESCWSRQMQSKDELDLDCSIVKDGWSSRPRLAWAL